ncbi:transposable element Tcb2 transposase [Trichonephila clavipes]|uniref:Transposable element Tcb2 transposase n=1 Tax=Trichonephila clavipes TaxID=2585209 RepID=A0A8X6R3I0_TRICX|nr:transposable element Tcb2 transposase [Trichonephila clavipes]
MSEWDYTNERVLFWMDLNGDFEWVCSTITSQNIYGRAPTIILLTMRPSRLFVEIRFHAVPSTRKRSATSRREDLHIVRNARVQPTASTAVLQGQVVPSLGAPASSRTIRRRLAEGQLGLWRPLRVLPLTPTHQLLRLEWCRARGNRTAAEWNQVVFSDESRFNLSSDDHRVRVWRPRSKCLNHAFALQRHPSPVAGVMVWDAIAYNIQSPLVLIRCIMAAQRYVHDILQPHVLLLMQRLSGAIFQQDNVQPHTVRVSQDCLRTVSFLPWPARSPDLSPIKHIWDRLGWRVGHPTSLKELEARLQQIWKEMSQDIVQNLYASMPDGIASCIRARGGSTVY